MLKRKFHLKKLRLAQQRSHSELHEKEFHLRLDLEMKFGVMELAGINSRFSEL